MTLRTSIAALALASTCFALTSCGGDGVTIPTSEGDVSIDGDNGEFRVETDEGEVVAGTGDLPDGFPEEIPLIDGTIVAGIAANQEGGQGFSVQITAGGSPSDVIVEAASLLEGAGFTEESQMSATDVEQRSYTSADFNVSVSATGAGDETFVQYIVAPVTP